LQQSVALAQQLPRALRPGHVTKRKHGEIWQQPPAGSLKAVCSWNMPHVRFSDIQVCRDAGWAGRRTEAAMSRSIHAFFKLAAICGVLALTLFCLSVSSSEKEPGLRRLPRMTVGEVAKPDSAARFAPQRPRARWSDAAARSMAVFVP
jgi:hypothetical protein